MVTYLSPSPGKLPNEQLSKSKSYTTGLLFRKQISLDVYYKILDFFSFSLNIKVIHAGQEPWTTYSSLQTVHIS